METVAAFFGGNPLASPVGVRIEQATDASLAGENWTLNMEICDIINDTEEGPKDAVRAIKKRFQQNAGKNHTVILYTLAVLETCVKNCGRRLHVLVCSKDFIQEMVKLIGPKNDPPTEVQEKVLSLIQSWADAFQQQPELQGVVQIYNELKTKGIEFPMTNLDTMAPILTPRRTSGEIETSRRPAQRTPAVEATQIFHDHPPVADVPNQPITLNATQLSKLQRELGVVEGNMSVLSEMLAELVPGQEHPTDLELLRELFGTCKAMQHRLVELVDRVANDEMTAHLLKLNDDLNNLFLRYERYEKNRNVANGGIRESPMAVTSKRPAAPVSPSLIDLGSDEPCASAASAALPVISSNMQALGLNSNGDEKEFDMFAQSRNVTYETSKQSGVAYGDPDQLENASLGEVAQRRQQEGVKEEDIEAMEKWLDTKTPHVDDEVSPAMRSYLQRRAAERDQQEESNPRRKKDDSSNMFSL